MSDIFLGPQKGSMSRILAENNEDDMMDAFDEAEPLTFDSWLTQYLQNMKDIASQHKLRFENFEKVFDVENEVLKNLFEPVQRCIQKALLDDKKDEGKRLYNQWKQLKRKQFDHSCFHNVLFRAQYTNQRFHLAAGFFMQSLALRIIPRHPQVADYVKTIRRVISVGVGPCSDVAGMVAFLRARGMNQSLTYYLFDQCDAWNEYIQECDRCWNKDYNVTLWFKALTVGRSLESLKSFPEADLIVFSFSDAAIMNVQIWPYLRQHYRLVIVLDGIKRELHETFSQCNYTICNLNSRMDLYYSYRDEEDCNPVSSSLEQKINN